MASSNILGFHFVLLVATAAATFLLILWKHMKNNYKNIANLPPSPARLPFIGHLHHILFSSPHIAFHRLSRHYGPLMFLQLGSIPTIVISSAEALREVLKAHDITFSDRPMQTAGTKLSYSCKDMFFTQYNDPWRQARKVSVLELLSTRRIQMGRSIRETEVHEVMNSIRHIFSEVKNTDVAGLNFNVAMNELSNKIVCRLAFGIRNDTKQYKIGDPYKLFRENQWLLGAFFIGDYVPWLKWIHILTGQKKRLEKNWKELDEFYNQVITQHIDDLNSRSQSESNHNKTTEDDFVHVLLSLRDGSIHGNIFNDMDYIKGMLMNTLVAGTDTSASTLSWAMSELLRHPRVMAKAQREVREVAGNKNKVEEIDLPNLHYIKLVIKETLRLRAPVPLIPRKTFSSKTCKIFGYDIPANTTVYINARSVGMDSNQWEKPEAFRPERFVDQEGYKVGVDFDVVAFGVGRRSCPGMNFALAVVELTLANLLCCFDWRLPKGMDVKDLDMTDSIGLTVNRDVPLWVVPVPVGF